MPCLCILFRWCCARLPFHVIAFSHLRLVSTGIGWCSQAMMALALVVLNDMGMAFIGDLRRACSNALHHRSLHYVYYNLKNLPFLQVGSAWSLVTNGIKAGFNHASCQPYQGRDNSLRHFAGLSQAPGARICSRPHRRCR